MANRTTIRKLSAVAAIAAAGTSIGCVGGATARDDYYVSRSISPAAQPGDGSLVVVSPDAHESAWSARLTVLPLTDEGDFASSR